MRFPLVIRVTHGREARIDAERGVDNRKGGRIMQGKNLIGVPTEGSIAGWYSPTYAAWPR